MQNQNEKNELEITVNVPVTITEQMIKDAIDGMWGSCAYWCDEVICENGVRSSDITNPDWHLKFLADEEWHSLTMDKIKKNIKVFANYAGGRYLREMVNEEPDGDTDDVFIQCMIFGEVVYG